MEDAFFFQNQGELLFGMLHNPEEQRHATGFVFCDGFEDEAFRSHRELVVYARRLAQLGFPVLRFDYRGCGDSAGRFEDYTIESRLSDIRRAMDLLQERAGVRSVGLLGLRFGATLAAAVADGDPRVDHLILWAPIVHTDRYLRVLQMAQMTHELANFGRVISSGKSIVETLKTHGTFDLGGNLISRQIYEEMRTFNPWRVPRRLPAHVLIVGFLGDTTKATDLQAIARMYPGAEFAQIKERALWFDKHYQSPTTLYETTARWLERVFADHRPPPRPDAPRREGQGAMTDA